MNSTANCPAPCAIDYFGGRLAAYKKLATAVRSKRKEYRISPAKLGAESDLSRERVEAFEAAEGDPATFHAHQVLTMLTQLGLTIDRVLPFYQTITKRDKDYWAELRTRSGEDFLAGSRLHAGVDPNIVLDIFIRVRALEELFPGKISKPEN